MKATAAPGRTYAHAQIQLEVGTPLVAPVTITFPSGV